MLLANDANRIEAKVEGSGFTPYRVKVDLRRTGVRRPECTCQFEEDGWCKHIVAAILAAIDDDGAGALERRSIEDRLAELRGFEAEALVADACRDLPGFPAFAERWLEGTVAQDNGSGASARADMLSLARTEALSSGSSLDGDLDNLVERALLALDRDRASDAVTILERVTAVAVREYESLDDTDGEFAEFVRSLGRAWIDAALMLGASKPPGKLAKRVATWHFRLDEYDAGEEFRVAVLLLEESAEEAATLLSDDDELLRELHDAHLRVFARRGQVEPYLALARKIGARMSYLAMLVYAGKVDRAVADSSKVVKSPEEALHLATLLAARGNVNEALQVGERGLALRGGLHELATWVRDLAVEHGNPALALRAAELAVLDWPTLDGYRSLRQLASTKWKRIRGRILKAVQTSQNDEGAIRILLDENLMAAAIQTLERPGVFVSYELFEAMVKTAISADPEWAIRTSCEQAERIMDPGKSEYYHHAGRWLARARDAYRAANREDEWQRYRTSLLLRHKRRLKLVAILKSLAD